MTESQIRTFDEDARRFDSEPGGEPYGAPAGPPTGPAGYRSREWNRMMIASSYYYKIELDRVMVGGLIVVRRSWSEFHIVRLWVGTAHQGQGIGSRAVVLLYARFPQATLWTVEAPAWAYRRQHFYKRCGLEVVRERNGTVYCEQHRKGILRLRSLP